MVKTIRSDTARRMLLEARFDIVLQRDGVVVGQFLRAEEQRHASTSRGFDKRRPGCRVRVELGEIAPAELLPLGWIMPKPVTQFVAGRRIFGPGVELEGLLLQPARPQTIHQKSAAFF